MAVHAEIRRRLRLRYGSHVRVNAEHSNSYDHVPRGLYYNVFISKHGQLQNRWSSAVSAVKKKIEIKRTVVRQSVKSSAQLWFCFGLYYFIILFDYTKTVRKCWTEIWCIEFFSFLFRSIQVRTLRKRIWLHHVDHENLLSFCSSYY